MDSNSARPDPSGQSTARRPIALVGFMGSGKSTVGGTLIQMLDANCILADTDDRVARDAWQPGSVKMPTVAELFAQEGETRFRERESHVLNALLTEFPAIDTSTLIILSTGGGIVLREENRRRLRESCFVVWLTAHVGTILARVQAEARARPLIAGHADRPDDLRAHILTMLGQRAPLYQETAHLVVDTSDREPEAIAREILRKYERAQREEANQP